MLSLRKILFYNFYPYFMANKKNFPPFSKFFGAVSLLLIIVSTDVFSQPDAPRPTIGPCHTNTGIAVLATASPDLGIITPHTLVRVGTKVSLHGICEHLNTNSQCRVSTTTIASFA
jgi:hypothetical protein